MDSRDKLKKFVFTLNNYTEAEETAIRGYIIRVATYAIVGHEVAPETKTPHLQGFVNLSKQSRFTAIKKIMPRAHVEKARGTDEDNRKYCSKAGDYWEHGEPQKAGKRNDLTRPAEMVKEGKTFREIAMECPVQAIKYHRGIKEVISAHHGPRDRNDPPTVIWLWGRTGVGKTRLVYDQFAEGQIYKKDNTIWWDRYEWQQCILIDDFIGKWDYDYVLQLTDRFPFVGQVKGGYVEIDSPFIIFTCEHPPAHFWTGTVLEQIMRRITMVQEMA